jgi:hypothetical protein
MSNLKDVASAKGCTAKSNKKAALLKALHCAEHRAQREGLNSTEHKEASAFEHAFPLAGCCAQTSFELRQLSQ